MNKLGLLSFFKITFVAALLCTPNAQATDQVGIVASISPNKQTMISKAVDSRTATQNLANQTNHPKSQNIYWFARNKSQTYHSTLEILCKKNKTQFSSSDLDSIATICQNFNTHAKYLNDPNNNMNGKKAYRGKGYELRLFVHYTDGSHKQFNARNVTDLLKSTKDVTYAHVVLKLGTHGGLKKDWNFTRQQILPHHTDLTCISQHALETHITIGSICKYTKQQNHIVGKQVKRKNGKKGFNTPFLCNVHYEMQMLVDTFNEINNHMDQNALKNIFLDRLQVTGKDQTGKISVLREVKFK